MLIEKEIRVGSFYQRRGGHKMTYISAEEAKKVLPKERKTTPEQCASADVYTNSCKADYIYNQALDDCKKAISTHFCKPVDNIFIKHIQAHLKPDEEVICKIS